MAEIREVYGKVIRKDSPLLGGLTIDELHEREGGLINAQEADASAQHEDPTPTAIEQHPGEQTEVKADAATPAVAKPEGAPRKARVLPDDETFDHMKGTAAEVVERLILEVSRVYGVPKATARSAVMGAVMES
jgi:hypothetical protein